MPLLNENNEKYIQYIHSSFPHATSLHCIGLVAGGMLLLPLYSDFQ